ncbi:hypothetical protein BFJ66_g16883 [Fusarium oxysporum f. sp. cepae]|nr:hypothetical protein BFJ66_g16883 [Fusarium oxysporum f. sp. cepae]
MQLAPEQYSRLEELHLNFNLPEPAIICTGCGFALAVDGDRVGRHLGKEHQVPKLKRRKINSLINSLQLPNPESLPQRPDNSAPTLIYTSNVEQLVDIVDCDQQARMSSSNISGLITSVKS